MKYTEAGTYHLTYKAVDECGNETTETRVIEVLGKMTTLYTDGTLYINERASERELHISTHGAVVEEYEPLSATYPYVLNNASDQPWINRRNSIKQVFIAAAKPTSMAYWFQDCTNLEYLQFYDTNQFDGSECTSIRAMCANTKIVDFSGLPEMPKLTNVRFVCNSCTQLHSASFDNVNATNVTDINGAFQGCYALEEIDLSGLSGTIEACSNAFSNTSGGGDMALTTIYSDGTLDFSQATASSNVFRACTSLVGGEGTPFNSSFIGKQYARIDNPPDAPGYFTAKQ